MGGYTAGRLGGCWVGRCIVTFAVLMIVLWSGNLLANSSIAPSTDTVVQPHKLVGQVFAVSNDPGPMTPEKSTLQKPLLGLAKTADNIMWLGANRFRTTITLYASNTGDQKARDLNILDNLVATFGSPDQFDVLAGSLTSDTFRINPRFNGASDTAVLATGNFLAPGAQGRVEFAVEFEVDESAGTFTNSAEIIAGNAASDWSTQGLLPDPDGDGSAAEQTPTDIPYAIPQARLGLAKSVSAINRVGENTFVVDFQFIVENFGQGPATHIDILDDLTSAFAGVVRFNVVSGSVSSAAFLINEGFDGVDRQSLLLSGNTLAAGETGTLTFSVEFEIDEETPALANSARVISSTGPADDSTSGRDPDPNGDNRPDESGATNISVEYTPPLVERVGLAKAVDQIEVIQGQVNVRLHFVVANLGSADLRDLQIIDNLKQMFPQGVAFEIVAGSLQSPDLPVNQDFDGRLDTSLLAPGSVLLAGERASLSFELRFVPLEQSGTFFNTADVITASGIVDQSTTGTEPDPNGDGMPDEAEPTAIAYALPPSGVARLGLAKAADEPVLLASGQYQVRYRFTIENFGDAAARSLSLVDNLEQISAAVADFAVVPESLFSADLAVNQNFDGQTDLQMLGADVELAAGQVSQIEFLVAFSAPLETTLLANTAQVSALNTASDESVPGTEPDPDGNNVPDESGTTEVVVDPVADQNSGTSILGLAKKASPARLQGDVYVSTLTFVVENLGSQALADLQIIDDLSEVFPAGVEFSVVEGSLNSTSLLIDQKFDGVGFSNLLQGTDVLAPGATASLQFDLAIRPDGRPGPFQNIASATAKDGISDTSTDGLDPDPDGNGVPDEEQVTLINLDVEPDIELRKMVTAVEQTLQGYLVSFEIIVINSGNLPLAQVQLRDDLQSAFADVSRIELVTPAEVSGALTKSNSSFSLTEPRLLSGDEVLPVGAQARITFQVLLDSVSGARPLTNTVAAAALTPDGRSIEQDASVQIELPSGLTGVVFLDENHNGVLDESETSTTNYEVELFDADQQLVATSEADNEGRYNFSVAPAGEYELRYRQNDSRVVWGSRTVLSVPGSVTVVNLPVSPQGVVYDSSVRVSVAGVQVGITDTNGVLLPEQCLLDGQQNQITDASGRYVFALQYGADPRCPVGAETYQIMVSAVPAGYVEGLSSRIPPQDGVFDARGCTSPCLLQTQNEPPQISADTDYYAVFRSGAQDPVLINNHLPIDRAAEAGPPPISPGLEINVSASRRNVPAGGVVGYVIVITNTSDLPASSTQVIDQSAPSVSRIDENVLLIRPGLDGVLGTDDDDRQDWTASGGRQTGFMPFDIPAQSQVQIEFVSRVSANARPGPQENRSTAAALFPTGLETVSDTAVVNVISDALMDKATVIGKVFLDHNRNGVQDEDATPPELGLAGVRLLTPEGLLIETDRHGRYHVADVEVSRSMGINYVVKIDTHTLPESAQVLNDLRQVTRLMPGDIGKINFAVFIPGAEQGCCPEFLPRASWDPFRPEKKLDVWVASIAERQAGNAEVAFHITSNYYQSLGSGLLSFSPGGDAAAVSPPDACFEFPPKLSGTPLEAKVNLPVQPGVYEYVLKVFQENVCAVSETARSGFGFDQTAAQRVDLSRTEPGFMGEPLPGRDLTEISGIVLPSGVRRLSHDEGVLLVENLLADSDAYEESHAGSWRIVDASGTIDKVDNLPRLLSENRSLEVNFDWRGVGNEAEKQGVTLHHGLEPDADTVIYEAKGATTYMTCCNVPTSAGIFVDDNNSVSTLRLSNLSDSTAVDVCVQTRREGGAPGAGECLYKQTLLPQRSSELFLGVFDDGPLSTNYWDELRVVLRDPAGREFFYDVTRTRAAEDGVLRRPRVTATCFDVTATPQLTEDRGVAAITLQSDAPPAPLPAQNYGVGVLDLTFGQNQRSGDLDNSFIDEQWNRGSYSDGRIAAYWRGVEPLAGRDLSWVLQLDSSKDELRNLADNLQREDPNRIFRQLDGDLYYPTYGDDSTTLLDTNSQGAFYARVNYAQSHALWGNYNTQLTGTEFSHYNRSLYGFQSRIRTESQNFTGSPRHALKLFASQAQSALAHAEFGATGGSLYYLRHTDIVMGSEKVWVEVRRQNTQQVEEREILIAGRDYEVDPLQGRILLRRPLSQIMQNRWQSVVQSLPLDGDRVFLLVDYEYVPTDFGGDDLLYGGRVESNPLNPLIVGFTHVTERQDRGDFQLNGLDTQLRWGANSYVSAEYAHTDNLSQSAGLRSFDGGLTFDTISPGFTSADVEGEALGFESYVDLADVNLTEGLLRAWWKRRAQGFNSGRFALGPQVTDRGVDFEARLNPVWKISASAGELEQQGVTQSQTARAQLSGKACRPGETGDLCRYFDVEGRYERSDLVAMDDFLYEPLAGEANLLGLRFGQDLNAANTLYATLQKVVTSSDDYPDNDRVAIGWNNKVSDDLSFGLEGSSGDRGHALTGGVNFALHKRASVNLSSGVGSAALTQFSSTYQLSEGHEVYGSYRVSPDRNDGERNMMTFGQRRDMGSRTRIFTESQFGKDPRQASTGHVLGLEYDVDQKWVISSTLQKSLVERSLGDYRRTAVSAGASYQDHRTRFSTRFEVRNDEGDAADLSQYLASSAFTLAIDENRRVLAKLNVSWLDDRQSTRDLGRFVELDLGYAVRPVSNDRFNLISRYSYLFDVGSQGQTDSPGDERSHILATEGLYEMTRRLRLGGKLAYRSGETRLGKGEGAWFDMRTALAVARFEYQIVIPDDKNWLFYFPNELEWIAEYRWLRDFAGDGRQQGALLGIYKQIDGRRINLGPILAPSLRVGVGYNFSGFDDDMRSSTFKSHGWFVDMMALF